MRDESRRKLLIAWAICAALVASAVVLLALFGAGTVNAIWPTVSVVIAMVSLTLAGTLALKKRDQPHEEAMSSPTMLQSQEDWINVRKALKLRRVPLARALARGYYPADRISDSGLIGRPEWRPERPVDLRSVTIDLRADAPNPEIDGTERNSEHVRPSVTSTESFTRYSFAMRSLAKSPNLSNRSSWRVLAVKGSDHLVFGYANYFEGLDVSEALAHEAAAILPESIAHDRPITASLPFRNFVNPATDLNRRRVIPAISTLVIRNDPKNPTTILHQRDPDTATAGGTVQVIPSGTFQPSCREQNFPGPDFSLWRNIMREYDEELMGNPERDGEASEPIAYDRQFPYRELDAALATGAIKVFYLGFALDALTLWGELMTVAVFEPEIFDALTPQFRQPGGYKIPGNSEGPQIRVVPFKGKVLERILREENVQPAGEYCIRTALKHRDLILG
ncbi:XRE family transcriptional regulator [Actinoplanes sp. CA-131856]